MKLLKHFIFAYRDVGVRPLLLSLLAFVCLVSMAVSKGEFLQRVYINRAAIGLIHEIRSLPSYAQSCRRQNDQDAQQLVGAPIISANLPIALAYWSKGKCLLAEVELRSLVERDSCPSGWLVLVGSCRSPCRCSRVSDGVSKSWGSFQRCLFCRAGIRIPRLAAGFPMASNRCSNVHGLTTGHLSNCVEIL